MIEFRCNTPCSNCPYRKDAPLAHWDASHFESVLESDQSYLGKTFACHKKDDQICRGFLLDQLNRGVPSISLRFLISKAKVTGEYLDSVHSPTPVYESIEEMVAANFPHLLY